MHRMKLRKVVQKLELLKTFLTKAEKNGIEESFQNIY